MSTVEMFDLANELDQTFQLPAEMLYKEPLKMSPTALVVIKDILQVRELIVITSRHKTASKQDDDEVDQPTVALGLGPMRAPMRWLVPSKAKRQRN